MDKKKSLAIFLIILSVVILIVLTILIITFKLSWWVLGGFFGILLITFLTIAITRFLKSKRAPPKPKTKHTQEEARNMIINVAREVYVRQLINPLKEQLKEIGQEGTEKDTIVRQQWNDYWGMDDMEIHTFVNLNNLEKHTLLSISPNDINKASTIEEAFQSSATHRTLTKERETHKRDPDTGEIIEITKEKQELPSQVEEKKIELEKEKKSEL